MAFLVLLTVAYLQSVSLDYNPTGGIFFDCPSITLPSNPTVEQRESTKQKCIDAKWCLWVNDDTCTNDLCLKYLADTPDAYSHCENLAVLGGCTVRYLTDGFDCSKSDFPPIQTDRFCRATDNTLRSRGIIDECFYKDLKSIGQDWTGPRLCTGATCSNKTSSAGGTCAVAGSDCSLFDKNTNEYCGCLGKDYCDLYPGCLKSGSTCIFDQCTDTDIINPSSNTEDGRCVYGNGSTASNCKIRPHYTFGSDNVASLKWVCVGKDGVHPNECYGAVKTTVTPVNIPNCQAPSNCRYCDTTTVDETICSTAKILDKDSGAGITPSTSTVYTWSETENCTLVDIAEKYIGPAAGKYCTDGDRTVPSPDAASLIHISSITFVLMLVVAFLL